MVHAGTRSYLYLKIQEDPRNVPGDEGHGDRIPDAADDPSPGPLGAPHTPSHGFSVGS